MTEKDEKLKTLIDRLYWGQELSIGQVAKVINASEATVRLRMKQWGIKRRGRGGTRGRVFIVDDAVIEERLKALHAGRLG